MSTDNPIIMYIVVRKNLGMSPGKMAVQVGHGVQLIMEQFYEGAIHRNLELSNREHLFVNWLDRNVEGSYRKVLLGADEKEWIKVKELNPDVIVIDSGLTEINPHTETCACFWPIHKNERPKLLKRLRKFE